MKESLTFGWFIKFICGDGVVVVYSVEILDYIKPLIDIKSSDWVLSQCGAGGNGVLRGVIGAT